MTLPLTKAEQLYNEAVARLNNEWDVIDPFTLRRWLRDGRGLLDHADDFGRWQLWTIIGHCELRLAMVAPSARARLEAAHAAYEEAHRIRPSNPHSIVDVGRALGHLGRPREALPYFERAEQIYAPDSVERVIVQANLAMAHYSLEDSPRANVFLRRAIKSVRPDDAHTLLQLAQTAAQLGHEDDAAEIFVRFLAASQRRERGDAPAADVIRRTPSEVMLRAVRANALRDALVNVLARAEEPIPDDMATSAERVLSPEGWARFESLVEA